MRKRLTLAACILGSTIVFVDSTVVNVALPAIQSDLGGGLALQQWVVDAYLLTLGSLILVGGSLGDLFGEKRIFVIGVVAFAVTSLLCAVAWDEGSLIVARGRAGRRRRAAHARRRSQRSRSLFERRGARRRDRDLDGVDGDRLPDRPARRRLARLGGLLAGRSS